MSLHGDLKTKKMKNTIFNKIQSATEAQIRPQVEEFAKVNDWTIGEGDTQVSYDEALTRMDKATEFAYAQFTGYNYSGERCDVPEIPFTEMLHSSDAPVLLRRVISEIMVEPKEPALFLSNNVAQEIKMDPKSPLFITFPTVDALSAAEIAEGGEYPNRSFSVQEHQISIRLKKYGLQTSLTEEIRNHSIYQLVTLYMRQMNNAVNRVGESLCYTAMTERAIEVFNNNTDVTADRTSGVGTGQTWNASLALKDILRMCGVVVGNRYEPSHILVHPLAWFVIFQDPLIRATFFHQGQMGGNIYSQKPDFNQNVNMPFGISYVPYYALPYVENAALSSTQASGLGSSLYTDVYVIDAKNSLYMATRGDAQMDEMEDWFKDATVMKIKKHMGCSVKDGGKAITVARNVRVVENYQPVMTVRTTT